MRKSITLLMLMLVISILNAESWRDSTEIQKGRRIEPTQVSVTSTTAVKIVATPTTDNYGCDLSIVNNTDYLLWISSWSGVSSTNGFPILPRSHYSPQGITIANIWAIFDDAMSGTAKVYINKFMNR